jgi:chromosome segregation ATPase
VLLIMSDHPGDERPTTQHDPKGTSTPGAARSSPSGRREERIAWHEAQAQLARSQASATEADIARMSSDLQQARDRWDHLQRKASLTQDEVAASDRLQLEILNMVRDIARKRQEYIALMELARTAAATARDRQRH